MGLWQKVEITLIKDRKVIHEESRRDNQAGVSGGGNGVYFNGM
jgi:hypothetical protein